MTDLEAQLLQLLASAIAGGLTGYGVARWQTSKQVSMAELQREHEATMQALDDYLNWVVALRYVVDPFDRKRFESRQDAAAIGEEPRRYEQVLQQLLASEQSGANLRGRFADASYDLPLDAESLRQFGATIDCLRDFWMSFRASILPDSDGKIDTDRMFARILARDSLGHGEFEAQEVNLGVQIVSGLRYHLLREYKRQTKGRKALRQSDGALAAAGGNPVTLHDGRLRYTGPAPFTSPEYLEARAKPPGEIEAQNRQE